MRRHDHGRPDHGPLVHDESSSTSLLRHVVNNAAVLYFLRDLPLLATVDLSLTRMLGKSPWRALLLEAVVVSLVAWAMQPPANNKHPNTHFSPHGHSSNHDTLDDNRNHHNHNRARSPLPAFLAAFTSSTSSASSSSSSSSSNGETTTSSKDFAGRYASTDDNTHHFVSSPRFGHSPDSAYEHTGEFNLSDPYNQHIRKRHRKHESSLLWTLIVLYCAACAFFRFVVGWVFGSLYALVVPSSVADVPETHLSIASATADTVSAAILSATAVAVACVLVVCSLLFSWHVASIVVVNPTQTQDSTVSPRLPQSHKKPPLVKGPISVRNSHSRTSSISKSRTVGRPALLNSSHPHDTTLDYQQQQQQQQHQQQEQQQQQQQVQQQSQQKQDWQESTQSIRSQLRRRRRLARAQRLSNAPPMTSIDLNDDLIEEDVILDSINDNDIVHNVNVSSDTTEDKPIPMGSARNASSKGNILAGVGGSTMEGLTASFKSKQGAYDLTNMSAESSTVPGTSESESDVKESDTSHSGIVSVIDSNHGKSMLQQIEKQGKGRRPSPLRQEQPLKVQEKGILQAFEKKIDGENANSIKEEMLRMEEFATNTGQDVKVFLARSSNMNTMPGSIIEPSHKWPLLNGAPASTLSGDVDSDNDILDDDILDHDLLQQGIVPNLNSQSSPPQKSFVAKFIGPFASWNSTSLQQQQNQKQTEVKTESLEDNGINDEEDDEDTIEPKNLLPSFRNVEKSSTELSKGVISPSSMPVVVDSITKITLDKDLEERLLDSSATTTTTTTVTKSNETPATTTTENTSTSTTDERSESISNVVPNSAESKVDNGISGNDLNDVSIEKADICSETNSSAAISFNAEEAAALAALTVSKGVDYWSGSFQSFPNGDVKFVGEFDMYPAAPLKKRKSRTMMGAAISAILPKSKGKVVHVTRRSSPNSRSRMLRRNSSGWSSPSTSDDEC